MKLLVTGGAGYVGSHSCKYFSQNGIEVVVLDNLSRGFREFVKWGKLIEGDVCDLKACRGDLIEQGPYDGVLHCAAYAYVSEGQRYPELYTRNNVGGTLGLLDFVQEQRIPMLVFSSSCTVYGEKVPLPVTTQQPVRPFSVYGHTKALCEQAIQKSGKTFGLKYGLVRYFNAAGNDPEGEIFERHEPELHLLPNIYRAWKTETPLRVNGENYPTPDGTCIRDYVHVMDIARAHDHAFKTLDQNESVIMNVGSGTGYSILEVVKAFESATGKKIALEFGQRRPGDIPAIYAQTSADFHPTHTLEQIVRSTIEGFDHADFIPTGVAS